MSGTSIARALLAFGACLCATPAAANCADKLLYQSGFDGVPIAGSKAALVEAVERGEPIRVGWQIDGDGDGKADLTHWADATFLTIFEGEVFTQIAAIQRQQPMRGKADVRLYPGAYVEWRASIGSNGKLKGVLSDGTASPEVASVAVSWCSAAR